MLPDCLSGRCAPHSLRKMMIFMLVSLLVVLAGCSGKEAAPQESSKAETEEGTSKPAPVTLSMLVNAQANWSYSKDKPIWKAITEKTNVTINGQMPPGDNYNEALNLTIASGEMPDLMYMFDFAVANRYGQQGALVNILDYLDLMPNFQKWLEQYPEIKERYLSTEGEMFMFPNQGFGETERIIWLYREDIFRKNGLEIPESYEELYSVLKKLKQLYPDSYPFASRAGFNTLSRMAPQFDTSNGAYYDFDKDEWRYGPIEENYKKLVVFMNTLYKEGLIAPDWLSANNKKWEDSIANDKAFVFLDYMVMDYYNSPLRKDNPEFNMLFMPPPAGFPGAPRQNLNQNVVDLGMTVASTSSKIKEAMKYMDFFYTEEGRELSSWGIKGVTYDVVDGKKKFLEQFKTLSDLREKPGLLNSGTYTWIDYDSSLSISAKETQDAYVEARKYDSKLQPKPAYTDKENDVINSVGLTIQKHLEESITKFILGDRNISEWDQYVNEMNKLGVDQILAINKEAYGRVQQLK
ncbi:extracellular solute-binding protein [Paenibacillus eucommiae]|uniref:Aldouronate transport system substrate-binding protein n=1 Tax=Paenibacillus eucommiae TaxID=1355755 RepID=A0ABS4ILY2_9BACL|nr:extracellular solute-binding protein [Paenibacillus eucommiae]MBP1988549.1 putative aldouronate transport system substrate-binding protein [Paenibacillus eucommiae]